MRAAFDTIDLEPRRTLAEEVLACLGALRMPPEGSVPYLADLLESDDENILLGVLAYLESARLADARPHVESILRRPRLSLPVREAALDTLTALCA